MTTKVAIPLELKADFRLRGWASLFKGVLYAIREKYGAVTAVEIIESVWKMEDRVKNMTNAILEIFKIEGNDAETMTKWLEIWDALTGKESTVLERSKTIARIKITKCPFKMRYKDLSEINLIFLNIVAKTIHPKVICECPKGMCVGDPHCEYVWKIEE